MKKLLELILLIGTLLVWSINSGKVQLNKAWVITIFVVQIASLVIYTKLLDIEKRYKVGLSVLYIVICCIIVFFILQNN